MVRYLSLASSFVPRKLTDSDGTSVGAAETVGLPDGDPDGEAVGSELGAALTLGEGEGAGVGSSDGRPDGATETDGEAVGVSVGRYVGASVVGVPVGEPEGWSVGASVGDCPVFRVKVRYDVRKDGVGSPTASASKSYLQRLTSVGDVVGFCQSN